MEQNKPLPYIITPHESLEIGSFEQLQALEHHTFSSNDIYIRLINDISLRTEMNSIDLKGRSIHINGNGFLLSNVIIKKANNLNPYVGLFNNVDVLDIKDIAISDIMVSGDHAGLIAGQVNKITATNVALIGEINGNTLLGGLVGSINLFTPYDVVAHYQDVSANIQLLGNDYSGTIIPTLVQKKVIIEDSCKLQYNKYDDISYHTGKVYTYTDI